ncbi:MAG: hypothetical protein LBT93_02055, partial [Treponema sp.]|nr:hypothetical protein [Treponema sp.]
DGATPGVFPAAADQVGSSGAASVDPAGPAPPPLISDEGIVAVAPPAAVSPVRPAAPSPDTTPEGYLRRAREEFDAGRIGSALSVLDHFREQYPGGSDEVWWLYGQLFEANGPNRDIRSALDYYRRLIREYPQSPRYAEARRRIAYLERYYFNIP